MKTIIHIGQPKTATSSIQYFLKDQQHYFASKGLYVPDPLGGRKSPSQGLLNVYALNHNRFSPIKDNLLKILHPSFFSQLKQDLENEISRQYQRATNQGCNTMLWSNEGLYFLNSIEEYQRLIELFTPHSSQIICICCFREQASFKTSYLKQLKSNQISLNNIKDSYRYLQEDSWLFNYQDKKNILQKVFDQTLFFPYDSNNNVSAFMKKIDFPVDQSDKIHLNVSPP